MIYKFTFVFLPALGIGHCTVPDLLPPVLSYDKCDLCAVKLVSTTTNMYGLDVVQDVKIVNAI